MQPETGFVDASHIRMNGAKPLESSIRLTLQRAPLLTVAGAANPLSPKDAALLAVLALDGSCARDKLAQMLWPDADLPHALASLRQRRFRLARVAGVPLIDGENTLQLSQSVAHAAQDPTSWLEHDPACLDGDLLEGLQLDECADFAHWLELARERWRVQRAHALVRLSSQYEEAAQLEPAMAVAQRLVADDPLSEHAHRILMRLHYLRGDLGAALRTYRDLAERLDAELGELPDDETASLAAALRSSTGQAPVRNVNRVPAALRRPPRLIGRETQWAALDHALAEGRTIVIEGAPGVGKTRLLVDYVAQCDSSNVLLLTALAGDQARPYSLLTRILARLWLGEDALRPSMLSTLPDWTRRELAGLLPELGAAPRRTDPARLQRAVAHLLAQAKLTLVALDDVQQADAATMELLPALSGPDLPCWWLACRAGETPSALSTWLDASNPPLKLSVAPLQATEINELLNDLALPHLAGAEWANKLASHTGGLPLFILETLRSQCEHPREDLALAPGSPAVAQTVRARAARLPEAARQLAHVIALLCAPLPLDAAPILFGGTPTQWIAAFEWLETSHWLDSTGRMHDLVSAALRDAMPMAEKRWLHGKVATWLLQRQGNPVECAVHFEAAGRDSEAAPLFEDAGRSARIASRPSEEATLFERAAMCWERAGQRTEQILALNESIEARSTVSGTVVAIEVAKRMLGMAATPAERVVALNALAAQQLHRRDYAEAAVVATEAVALSEVLQAIDQTVKAAASLAHALSHCGRSADALAVLGKVHPTLGLARPETRFTFATSAQFVYWAAKRMADTAASLREAISQLVQDENWNQAAISSFNLVQVLNITGHITEAWEVAQQAERWWNLLEGGKGLGGSSVAVGIVQLSIGRIGSALAQFERAFPAEKRSGFSIEERGVYENRMASCHLLRCDADAAAGYLATGLDVGVFVPGRLNRRRLLAHAAALRGEDPMPFLECTPEELAAVAPGDVLLVEAERAWFSPDRSNPEKLAALEDAARVLEQGALATRLAWWRVDALRHMGDAAAAARLAHKLLNQPLWPSGLLPCHWLWIAQEALHAAGDPTSAEVAERARNAYDEMLADLGVWSAPSAQWPPSNIPRPEFLLRTM